jgi:integrase
VSKRRAKGDGSVYTRKDGRVVGEWTEAHGRARYMTSTKMSKTEMSNAVRKKLKAGLSPRSVQIIHATAHKMLRQVVR